MHECKVCMDTIIERFYEDDCTQCFYCRTCFYIFSIGQQRNCIFDQKIIEERALMASPRNILIVSDDDGFSLSNRIECPIQKVKIGFFLSEQINDCFDVIIVPTNAFNKIDNPSKFLQCCRYVSHTNTVMYVVGLCFNVGTQNPAISYYNTNCMKQLCQRNELTLLNSYLLDNIYLYEISNNRYDTRASNVADALYDEMMKGVYDDKYYKTYQWNYQLYKNTLQNILIYAKLQNVKAIGLREHCRLFKDLFDVVVDDTDQLQNVLSEQTHPFEYLLVWPCHVSAPQKTFYILNTKTLEVT